MASETARTFLNVLCFFSKFKKHDFAFFWVVAHVLSNTGFGALCSRLWCSIPATTTPPLSRLLLLWRHCCHDVVSLPPTATNRVIPYKCQRSSASVVSSAQRYSVWQIRDNLRELKRTDLQQVDPVKRRVYYYYYYYYYYYVLLRHNGSKTYSSVYSHTRKYIH